MKRLPITAAKLIAEKYDQAQVIIMTFDRRDNLVHVVSYGKTKKECAEAAEGAKFLLGVLKNPSTPNKKQECVNCKDKLLTFHQFCKELISQKFGTWSEIRKFSRTMQNYVDEHKSFIGWSEHWNKFLQKEHNNV